MVKQVSSKISDPRPRINVVLQSDDEKTEAVVNKGYVNVQRGKKKAILRIPYGEVAGIVDLLTASAEVLDKNGYDSKGGSDIDANAVPVDATDDAVAAPGSAEAAGVTSIATEGDGASPVQEAEQETAAEQAQADFDSEPSYQNPFEGNSRS